MTRPRRLSLRARMLILLIGVTAIFLLIMGMVSTVVLTSRRRAASSTPTWSPPAARGPAALADNTGGYLAEAVSARTGQIVVLTPGPQANGLADVLSQMTRAEYLALGPQRAGHPHAARRQEGPRGRARRSGPRSCSSAGVHGARRAATSWSWPIRPTP